MNFHFKNDEFSLCTDPNQHQVGQIGLEYMYVQYDDFMYGIINIYITLEVFPET